MATPNDATESFTNLDQVIAAYLQAIEAGQVPNRQELLDRHPELAERLRAFFADLDRVDLEAAQLRLGDVESPSAASGPSGACPPSVTSATTSCWKRSPAAAWGSFTRRGRPASTESSPSR